MLAGADGSESTRKAKQNNLLVAKQLLSAQLLVLGVNQHLTLQQVHRLCRKVANLAGQDNTRARQHPQRRMPLLMDFFLFH